MKRKSFTWLAFLVAVVLLAAACQNTAQEETGAQPADEPSQPMMGPGSSMMARHHATIPAGYAGLTNPVQPDEDSLARGAEVYETQCATCHGQEGLGDGPTGTTLDPLPAPLAHTSRMLADAYLFWRVSEGGGISPFNSAMPAWKTSLEEGERWDVINYLRLLAGGGPGSAAADPQAEVERRAEMLAQALDQELITEEEAALFDRVHAQMDALMVGDASGSEEMMASEQDDLMAKLIEQGAVSQDEVQVFNEIHDRLLAAGLMQ